jgi:hypothetical protein
MSSFPRHPILPNNFKDLVELVRSEQQTNEALARAEQDIAVQGKKMAPLIFARLYRKIDHDLLFCSESALVMPDIRATVATLLKEMTPDMSPGELDSWIVDIVSREARDYILKRKPASL